MGKAYTEIPDHLRPLLKKLPVYYVASAPTDPKDHINISPKSNDGSFCIMDKQTVAYLDLVGSGAETGAHISSNGRLTMMFCTTEEEDAPQIVRLYGKARIMWPSEVLSHSVLKHSFPSHLLENPGFRAVYVLSIDRVQTSCGYAVPIMEFKRHRVNETHRKVADKMGREGVLQYQVLKNSFTIDGKKGLAQLKPDAKAVIPVVEQRGYYFGKEIAKMSWRDAFFARLSLLLSEADTLVQAHWAPLCCFLVGVSAGALIVKQKGKMGS
mmetsp:Transcript_47164/g.93048  ORF Transcript_47164/g.93048 Transcript_47164/m.93048 type:complete len:268 (+) Transcript_47164:120-923(+)